jgi:hypothetical protein
MYIYEVPPLEARVYNSLGRVKIVIIVNLALRIECEQ